MVLVARDNRLSANDHFFDLGGDSLAAARFIGQLRAMDIDLPLMTMFVHPTLSEVAAAITDMLLTGLDHADESR